MTTGTNAYYTLGWKGSSGKVERLEEDIQNQNVTSPQPIDAQIDANQLLLDGLGPEDAQRWSVLSRQGELLSSSFKQHDRIEVLVQATSCYREALSLRPQGQNDLERLISLHHLATATKACFKYEGYAPHLVEAVYCSIEAETLAREIDHPYLTWFHFCIARTDLAGAQDIDPDTEVLPSHKTAAYTNASAEGRFNDVVDLAKAAHALGHACALQAYKLAFLVAERCLVVRFTPSSQHEFLMRQDVRALPSQAAACAVQAGDLEAAVELLEQGRGQIWSKMRDYRYPLETLVEVSEELAMKFRETCVHMELFSTHSSGTTDSEERSEYKKMVLARWNETLQQIRALDGFSGFLRPKAFSSLRAAATPGPIIIIYVDSHRSDAIIVQSTGAPVLVPLPKDLPRIVFELSQTMSRIKGHIRASKFCYAHGQSSGSLTSVLQKLWTHICEPVTAQLCAMGMVAEQSHIWWCPTGALTSLPIHAAGPYKDGERNLLDIYVSSYVPSLLSMIRAQASRSEDQLLARRTVTLLAAGQSKALSMVREELDHLRKVFSTAAFIFDDADAVPDRITRQIQVHGPNIVHFACHGFLNVVKPLDSYLALHEANLSLKEMAHNLSVSGSQLAFLAACHSAASETDRAAEENISLAAAFQVIGYRSVVGTLWAMLDADGPPLTKEFYGHLLPRDIKNSDCLHLDSANALHLSVKGMRDRGVPIERWSTFIHIGL